jgi:hypothetical protein
VRLFVVPLGSFSFQTTGRDFVLGGGYNTLCL